MHLYPQSDTKMKLWIMIHDSRKFVPLMFTLLELRHKYNIWDIQHGAPYSFIRLINHENWPDDRIFVRGKADLSNQCSVLWIKYPLIARVTAIISLLHLGNSQRSVKFNPLPNVHFYPFIWSILQLWSVVAHGGIRSVSFKINDKKENQLEHQQN